MKPIRGPAPESALRRIRDRLPLWAAPAAAMVVGIGLRLRQYAWARPLWSDEVYLAFNVLRATKWADVVAPLDFAQAAPFPLLVFTRVVVLLAGPGERALRFVPLATGIGALLLFWVCARQLLPRGSALLALALFAISPTAIYYCSEFKPYEGDVFFALLTVAAVLRLRSDHPYTAWTAATVGICSALNSLTLPFILPGLVLVAFTPAVSAVTRKAWLFVVGAIGTASVVAYVLLYRRVAEDGYMQTFWSARLLSPFRPHFWTRILGTIVEMDMGFIVGRTSTPISPWWGLVPALVMASAIVRRTARLTARPLDVLLLGPLGTAVALALADKFPLATRTALALLPWAVMLLAQECIDLWRHARWTRPIAFGALICTAGLGGLLTGKRLIAPGSKDFLAIIATLESPERGGLPLYVTSRSTPIWAYYHWRHNPDVASNARWLANNFRFDRYNENRESHVRPLCEADDFARSTPQGIDLYGAPTGVQFTTVSPRPPSLEPDIGWVANEVARLTAVAKHGVWMLLIGEIDDGAKRLLAALSNANYIISTRKEGLGVQLLFATPPATGSANLPRCPPVLAATP